MVRRRFGAVLRFWLRRFCLCGGLGAAATLISINAAAQPAPAQPAGQESSVELVVDTAQAPISAAEFEERLRRVEELALASRPRATLSGYVDFGFFVPQGNGAGYALDVGHLALPQFAGYESVFFGDIFAPAVNSRGEPADLGDTPGTDWFDSVNSRGAIGFILNEANFTVDSALSPSALVTVSFNLVPRTGSRFAWGDFFDLDLAELEWRPTQTQRTSIFIGKTDSVLGIEYRERKASRRFGVTPSLLARYTTGTALGLKVRSKFGTDDWFVVAAAVTNGSNTIEPFHFYDEVDSNDGKTISGRLSARLPFGGEWEIGASGSWGPQDRDTDTDADEAMWFFGVDLQGRWRKLALKAQWLMGESPGDAAKGVWALDLDGGAYLELNAMFTPMFGALLRGEYRDAFVWLGNTRAYVTKSWRATVGARIAFGERAALKLEYLRNGEYDGLPSVENDIFTSSFVFLY
jgi:hypothetical protein